MGSAIRPARIEDIDVLRDIERRAGQSFLAVGMDAIAHDDPPSAEDLTEYINGERAWVVAHDEDRPTAYVLVDRIDDKAHIEQVTVDPERARLGLGAKLIEHVAEWARANHLDGLTLTTFAAVPWNAPYYQRLGFRTMAPAELTDGLRKVRAREGEQNLDRWPRVAMIRPLDPPRGAQGTTL
jgi:GNAT superfamily N-acetyltransferase